MAKTKKKSTRTGKRQKVAAVPDKDDSLPTVDSNLPSSNEGNPLLNLPTEITCSILLLTLKSWDEHCFQLLDNKHAERYNQPESDADEGGSNMEVALSHVCQQWRSISLVLPELWTRFWYRARNCRKIPTKRFKIYLQRSGSALFDLSIDLRGSWYISDYDHQGFIESSIDACEPRLRRLTLRGEDGNEFYGVIVYHLSSLNSPNLEYFAISPGTYSEAEDIPAERLDALDVRALEGVGPKLSHVFMDEVATYNCVPPLSNVTTLQIEGSDMNHRFSSTAYASILSLPHLTNLSLKFLENYDEGPEEIEGPNPPGFPVTMSKLKSLRLSDSQDFRTLLFFIKAPILERLTIQDMDFEECPNSYPGEYPALKYLTLLRGPRSKCRTPLPNAALAKLFPAVMEMGIFDFGDEIKGTRNEWLGDVRTVLPALSTVALNVITAKRLDKYLKVWADRLLSGQLNLKVPEDVHGRWREECGGLSWVTEQPASGCIRKLSREDLVFRPKHWPENGMPLCEVTDEDFFYRTQW